jgi:hypothetical protein
VIEHLARERDRNICWFRRATAVPLASTVGR